MERKGFIGGSDVADIFSLPPYGCARKLWYEKSGVPRDIPEDEQENYHIRRGKKLEGVAAKDFEEKWGHFYTVSSEGNEYVDEEYPFMVAHIDRRLHPVSEGADRGDGILELKCPSTRMYQEARRGRFHDGYLLQLQHYLRVTDAKWGFFSFFSGEFAESFPIKAYYDQEMISMVVDAEKKFWGMVTGEIQPEKLPDNRDRRCMKCAWGPTCRNIGSDEWQILTAAEGLVTLEDPIFASLVREYWTAKEIADEAEEFLKGVKDQIREAVRGSGFERVAVGGSKIYLTRVDSMRWDTKRLERERPELVAEFKKPSASERLALYKIIKEG